MDQNLEDLYLAQNPPQDPQMEELSEEEQMYQAMAASMNTVAPTSGKHDKAMAGQAAMIAGVPSDPHVVQQVLLSENTRGKRKQAADAHYMEQQQQLNEYVNQQVLEPGTSAEVIATAAYDESQRIAQKSYGPVAEEQAYVEQAAPNAAPEAVDEAAAHMKALNVLGELAASQDWWDTAKDFAGLIVPGAYTKDVSDAADLINEDPELAAVAGPDLESIAVNFQALDPETKAIVFPRIAELVRQGTKTSLLGMESEGNVLQTQAILSAFLSADPGEQIAGMRFIDVALGVTDIASTGALTAVAKLTTGERIAAKTVLKDAAEEAVRRNNPMNIAKQAGDEQAAANHGLTAVRNPDVAESMNIDPVDVGLAGMPVETSAWFSSVTEGMSAAMVRQLEEDLQVAQGFTNSMTTERVLLNAGQLSASERKLAIEDFMTMMERKGEDYLSQNVHLENMRIVDEGPDGFTFEYSLRRVDDPAILTPPVRPETAAVDDVLEEVVTETPPAAVAVADEAEEAVSFRFHEPKREGGDPSFVSIQLSKDQKLSPEQYTTVENFVQRTGAKIFVGRQKPGNKLSDKHGAEVSLDYLKAQHTRPSTPTGGAPTPPAPAPVATQKVDALSDLASDTVVGSTRVTLTTSGSTLIKVVDVAETQALLKAAGLPTGTVNTVRGETYLSLAGKFHDDVVRALAKDAGMDLPPVLPKQQASAGARDVDKIPQAERTAVESFFGPTGTGPLSAVVAKALASPAMPAKFKVLLQSALKRIQELEAAGNATAATVVQKGGQATPSVASGRALGAASMREGMMELELRGSTLMDSVGASFETFTHEVLHTATMHILQQAQRQAGKAPKAVVEAHQELVDLFNAVVRHFNAKVKTGVDTLTDFERRMYQGQNNAMQNLDELVSWGLTNPEMQAFLKSVKYQGPQSMWQTFVKALSKLLGVKGGEGSALEALIHSSSKLLNTENKAAAQYLKTGGRGTALQMAPSTPPPPPYQRITGQVKFTLDQVTGTYTATTEALTANLEQSFVSSPATWGKAGKTDTAANLTDFVGAAKDSVVSGYAADAAQVMTDDFLRWVLEPVSGITNRAARARLDAVLLYGDEFINAGVAMKGRNFTPQELAAGFHIPGHKGVVRLTSPEEVTAYYRARFFADSMYQVENRVMRRQAEMEGLKEMSFGKERVLAKPYDTEQGALTAMRGHPNHIIYNTETGQVINFSEQALRDMYQKGFKLVHTRKPYNTTGGGVGDEISPHAMYLLVRDANIKDLPAQMLHYKPGYVPKVNKIEFMVKRVSNIRIPGQGKGTNTIAMRGFNSLRDAKQFRDEQIAKYLSANPKATYEQAEAKFAIGGAEDMTAIERIESGLGASGGLYTGMRSQSDLLYGLSGQRMGRIGALEAFQRQTAHMGTLVARNEMRLLQERRWLNTVRKHLPDARVIGFESTPLPDTAVGKALSRMRQQIIEWNGIPEQTENLFQASMQYLHDWMLTGARRMGLQGEGSYQSLQWLKHSNVVTAAKAANMHVLLGCYSIRQLWAQASAALVAASRRFDVSLTGDVAGDVRTAFRFAQLDNMRNTQTMTTALNRMVAKGTVDPRVAEAYLAYRRTGFYESATNNADIAKLSVDGLGASMELMRKGANHALLFYRAGEMFNRRYSFIKEFAAWRKANPKAVLDDDALQTIIWEADKDMLHMSTATKAYWQGGVKLPALRQIMGLATQFMQVSAKGIEAVAPNKLVGKSSVAGFTDAEKRRIMMGQFFLYGGAGIPLGNMAVGAVMNMFGVKEVDDQTALALNQGMVGWSVNNMLGLGDNPDQQLDISNNLSIGQGITEMLREFTSADDPLFMKFLGPAGSWTGSRLMDAYKELGILYQGSKEGMYELSGEDLVFAIREVASIPSSGNNIIKAILMNNMHQILDRRRNTVDERDYDFATEIGTAFGFRPSVETTARMTQQTVFSFDDQVQALADARVRMMHKAIFEHRMDPKKVEMLMKASQVLDEATANPDLLNAVNAEVNNRLWGAKKSAHEQAISDWMKRVAVPKMSEDARIDINLGFGKAEQAVTRPFTTIMQEE